VDTAEIQAVDQLGSGTCWSGGADGSVRLCTNHHCLFGQCIGHCNSLALQVRQFDRRQKTEATRLTLHRETVTALQFGGGGAPYRLAAGSDDGRVSILDVRRSAAVRSVSAGSRSGAGVETGVTALAFGRADMLVGLASGACLHLDFDIDPEKSGGIDTEAMSQALAMFAARTRVEHTMPPPPTGAQIRREQASALGRQTSEPPARGFTVNDRSHH
jgi:WD40 repeat protein